MNNRAILQTNIISCKYICKYFQYICKFRVYPDYINIYNMFANVLYISVDGLILPCPLFPPAGSLSPLPSPAISLPYLSPCPRAGGWLPCRPAPCRRARASARARPIVVPSPPVPKVKGGRVAGGLLRRGRGVAGGPGGVGSCGRV